MKSIVCLWIPDSRIDEERAAELSSLCLTLSPRVVVEARGVVWVEGDGLGGEALGRELLVRVKRAGVSEGARCGIAAAPIVAEGAARFGDAEVMVVGAGREGDFLAPLPLSLLTADERVLGWLHDAGIDRCGVLAERSAESVEVRFGGGAVELWRRARGEDRRRLFPPLAPERLLASAEFVEYSLRDATQLIFTLNALADRLCRRLQEGARRTGSFTLRILLTGGGEFERIVRTSRPTAERALWIRRLRSALETIELPDTISGVSLEAGAPEPISAQQGDLFDRGFSTALFVEEAVARLLERYRGLFVRASGTRHPLREQAIEWVALTPAEVAGSEGAGEPSLFADQEGGEGDPAALELQLLDPPRPLELEACVRRDHLLPVRYRKNARWHALHAAGPDRISGGHERGRRYAREYFRCSSDAGELLWIYRDAVEDRWYLHGWWD